MELMEEIPKSRWREGYESNQLPVRLSASSRFPVHVNSKGISPLPTDIPINELQLRFVAETHNRYEFGDIPGESYSLGHFIGLEPAVPDD